MLVSPQVQEAAERPFCVLSAATSTAICLISLAGLGSDFSDKVLNRRAQQAG